MTSVIITAYNSFFTHQLCKQWYLQENQMTFPQKVLRRNRRRLPWSVKYRVQVLFRLPYHLSAQLLAENVWTRPLYQSIKVVDQVLN